MLKVLAGDKERKQDEGVASVLDELAREGARRMIAVALEAEVAEYVARHEGERDDDGHALVVRHGQARERLLTVGAGTVKVRAPRVNDKRTVEGERQKFTSRILPPYMRRSPKVTEVLPLLYLAGLSSGDFREALVGLLGEDASGLSASAVTRLTAQWQEERRDWSKRSLADLDYVYLWVDGVHFKIRLEEDRLAALVVVGVRPDGTKELVAIEDGYRESSESWATLLRNLKARGMQPPVVAVGDGALGFWKAVGDVWPETKEQRCWVHKNRQRAGQAPQALAGPGQGGAARDDVRPEPQGLREGEGQLRPRVPSEISEGRQVAADRLGAAADVLRLPGGTLEAPAHDQPHRIDIRDGAAAHQGHEGCWLPGGRSGHGLQASP